MTNLKEIRDWQISEMLNREQIPNQLLQSMKQFNLMTQAKADILYVLHQSLHLMYTKLRSHGTLGKDNLKRNIVPPSVDSSMKKFFTADDPDMVIN